MIKLPPIEKIAEAIADVHLSRVERLAFEAGVHESKE